MKTYQQITALSKAQGVTQIELIIEALDTEGSIEGAARKLGVSHQAIRYHINKHKLISSRSQGRTKVSTEQAS